MYTLNGIIKVINDTQIVSDRFKKREIVITDNSGQYPQDILFQLTQEKTDAVNDFKVNEPVQVSFFIRGREWTSPQGEVKYFNSLEIWSIKKIDVAGASSSSMSAQIEPPIRTTEEVQSFTNSDDDDLPF
jgi:hypothetical protein